MDSFSGPLEQAFEDAQQQISQFMAEQQQSFKDVTLGFFHAIDWTEPWIISILITHSILFLTVILFRKNLKLQSGLFCMMMLIIFGAQQLNELGSQYWRKFSRQNYFDENGFFISMVISMPFVVIMLIIVVNYLISVSKLLIKMKRQQLRHEMRQRVQEATANGGTVNKKDD
eukprot:TRINITY_DN12950_c1_g1_i1.p1 TRINITY_DN12950_c1_g1~~TRINITY_DN12950_c1_g1_i1.p1  ORF type:complete len:172 (-),score=13.70 TRINITY_DN12950_c1_g1_i1:124-639(-)